MSTIANSHFLQFVNSVMTSERIPHGDAWLKASELKPDLHTLMLALGATRQRVAFLNERHQARCQQTGNGAARRIEARDEFHKKVHAYQDRHHVDYDAAYQICLRQFSNEAAAMSSGYTPALHSKQSGFAPLANPGLLSLFYLTSETPQDVFAAAYAANGSQFAVINAAKVFDGVVSYFMSQKSLSHDAAITYVKGQYPDLWAAVQTLAKTA
jgi:hypothetical protein